MTTVKNTFTGLQLQFPNLMLMAFMDSVILIRQQITSAAEVNKLNGFSDALANWMRQSFAVLNGDVDRLREMQNEDVVTSAFTNHQHVGHDLTGQSKNLRQPTHMVIRNTSIRIIVSLLDNLVVQCSHFDSRWSQAGIDDMEASQAEALLTRCYAVVNLHGGQENRRPLITGVLPLDLDRGAFNPNGEHDVEMGTLDTETMVLAEHFRTDDGGGPSPMTNTASPTTARTGPATTGGARVPGTPRR